MNEPQKYFAFISYKREDEEWAVWLQHELEYYHLPASLNGREDLPKVFRPVFRDIDELKAGNLPKQIHEALASSANLIVICSPRSAESIWVNNEIEAFIEIGKEKGINNLERVFPFIVEGTPHAKDQTSECFPKVLRDLPDDKERIGGNVNESGRDKAFIKVMAGMLPGVSIDTLWNRYERDKAEEERKKREERDKLLALQSRFVAGKAMEILQSLYEDDVKKEKATLIALEILPKDSENPERPLVPEAELALRSASFEYSTLATIKDPGFCDSVNQKTAVFSGFIEAPSSKEHPEKDTIRIYDITTGNKINEFTGSIAKHCLNSEGLMVAYSKTDNLWGLREAATGTCLFPLSEAGGPVFSAAFSPDNSLMATDAYNCKDNLNVGVIRIRDMYSGKCKTTISEPLGSSSFNTFNSILFSPDGKSLIASTLFNVIVWDVCSGQKTFSFTRQENGKGFYYANFLPNTNSIVCFYGNDFSMEMPQNKLFIVNLQNSEISKMIDIADESMTYSIYGIDYFDGKLFLTLSFGQHVYEMETGNFVCHLPFINSIIEKQGPTIKALDFHATIDGSIVYSVIKFDYLPIYDLIHHAREKYRDKTLTKEEKKKYCIE